MIKFSHISCLIEGASWKDEVEVATIMISIAEIGRICEAL